MMPAATTFDEVTGGDVNDTIVLNIPTGPAFRGVASLVLGGVGSRLDLPFERMDDLQLAVLSMLDASDGEQVSLEVHADDGRVAISVGPLREGSDSDDGLGLVLKRLTDGVESSRRGRETWLTVFLTRAESAQGSGSPAPA